MKQRSTDGHGYTGRLNGIKRSEIELSENKTTFIQKDGRPAARKDMGYKGIPLKKSDHCPYLRENHCDFIYESVSEQNTMKDIIAYNSYQ